MSTTDDDCEFAYCSHLHWIDHLHSSVNYHIFVLVMTNNDWLRDVSD